MEILDRRRIDRNKFNINDILFGYRLEGYKAVFHLHGSICLSSIGIHSTEDTIS